MSWTANEDDYMADYRGEGRARRTGFRVRSAGWLSTLRNWDGRGRYRGPRGERTEPTPEPEPERKEET